MRSAQMRHLEEISSALEQPALTMEELKAEDPEFHVLAKAIEGQFTAGVTMHRRGLFGPIVKELMAYAYDVIGQKHVTVIIGAGVPTLSAVLALVGNARVTRPAILVPMDWLQMVAVEPFMQLGGLVFTGSQAVDFYNDRHLLEDTNTIERRAWNYEAEFLRGVSECDIRQVGLAKCEPNKYQSRLMREFPRFDRSLDYARKPIVGKN